MNLGQMKKIGLMLASCGLMASAAQAAPKANIDIDGDGKISLDEFVMFRAEADIRSRDKNKDGLLSFEEWLGKGMSEFRKSSANKFDANDDQSLNITEIVEIYSWTFGNRDKDKDGFLEGKEIPKNMKK